MISFYCLVTDSIKLSIKCMSNLSEAKDEVFQRLVKRLLSYSSSARDAEKVPDINRRVT